MVGILAMAKVQIVSERNMFLEIYTSSKRN